MRLRLHHPDGTSEILEFTRDDEGRWVTMQDITLRAGQAFMLQPLPDPIPDDTYEHVNVNDESN